MEGPDDDVPSFFICPLSLQIMEDPVTISTGITYERESIQKWLFVYNSSTCPVTKQLLTDCSLTPNTTLLRLIQSWRLNNESVSPTKVDSQAPVCGVMKNLKLINSLVEEVREPNLQIMTSLGKIKSLIHENDDNKEYLEDAGMALAVASLINRITSQGISQFGDSSEIIVEATSVLCLLEPSTGILKKVSQDQNGLLIGNLSSTMQNGSYPARIQAALLLKFIFRVVADRYKAELRAELFEGITEILKDHSSSRATMAALSILMEVLPFGKNRIRAVEAGVVPILVELLAESHERRVCDIMLGVLEELCRTAEGRSAFLAHPAGVAAVVTKILRVSHGGNDRAVMVLLWVCRFCKASGIAEELMEVGGVAKLCMVVQADCNLKTKEKAKEILGLHLKAWNMSPCFLSCCTRPIPFF